MRLADRGSADGVGAGPVRAMHMGAALWPGDLPPRAWANNTSRFQTSWRRICALMPVRGIRGATTVTKNSKDEIVEATKELLAVMIESNDINPDDVASAFFTTTTDLNAE